MGSLSLVQVVLQILPKAETKVVDGAAASVCVLYTDPAARVSMMRWRFAIYQTVQQYIAVLCSSCKPLLEIL
jgi:hypothetical protein